MYNVRKKDWYIQRLVGFSSTVCIGVGMITSFISTVRAPPTPNLSAYDQGTQFLSLPRKYLHNDTCK